MIQISQAALCNRLHTAEERLARLQLMCRDRISSDEINLTQEFLAVVLGIGRAFVVISSLNLQGAVFITYQRGTITILDHESQNDFACDCYIKVKNEYDRYQNYGV